MSLSDDTQADIIIKGVFEILSQTLCLGRKI